jgi:antitoxin CptB
LHRNLPIRRAKRVTLKEKMNEHKLLRWRCRRGMRELDLVLQRFFDDHYDHLPDEGKQAFSRLLDQEDQDVLRWLLGHTIPPDQALSQLIEEIKDRR